MRSKLINVRLSPEDASKANALKAEGIKLSGLVRDAIRAEYGRRFARPRTGAELATALDAMHAQYPIPEDAPRVPVDISDRRAMSQYIRDHLERKLKRTDRTTKRRRSA